MGCVWEVVECKENNEMATSSIICTSRTWEPAKVHASKYECISNTTVVSRRRQQTGTAENRGRDSASMSSRAIPAGLAILLKSHARVHGDICSCNMRPGWKKRAWAYTKSRAAAARSIAGPRRGLQAVSRRGHPANVRASGCGRERAAAFGVADMPARWRLPQDALPR